MLRRLPMGAETKADAYNPSRRQQTKTKPVLHHIHAINRQSALPVSAGARRQIVGRDTRVSCSPFKVFIERLGRYEVHLDRELERPLSTHSLNLDVATRNAARHRKIGNPA